MVPRWRAPVSYVTLWASFLALACVGGGERAARARTDSQSHAVTLKSLSWRPDSIFARQRCVPPGDTGAVPSSSDTGLVRPGAYALELVATAGSRSGAAATGHLVLDEAHQGDRSPRTERAAYDWPAGCTYLYGATDLEFRAVAAPMDEPCRTGAPTSECGDSLVPPPTSEDPVFPGVRGDRVALPPAQEGRPTTLLIGTVGNARLHQVVLDGAGIGLTTPRAVAAAHSGDEHQ